MKAFYPLLGLLLLCSYSSISQCVECEPDLTCTSADNFPTICPEVLPDATAGAYYETVVTFFMPGTVVDPGTGIEATLLEIVVGSVNGLPFGLEWTTNSENNTYFPSQGENHGCATLCGTPLLAGDYEVVITVNVAVSAFGVNQNLVESFALPLTVLPGEGGNASFSYDNLVGCGTVSSNFEALIDGSPGITSYDWDFGDGASDDTANPPTQSYTEPGDYTVTLTTTIENYVLSSVSVSDVGDGWCGDIEEPFCNCGTPLIGTCPDIYFVITDGNGVAAYSSSTIDGSTSGSWNNINLLLNNPPYTITVWDEDSISNPDNLGTADLSLSTGNQGFSNSGTSGTVNISLEVSNVFTDEEVVSVFPIPNPEPLYDEELQILYYTDESLENFLWTLDGLVIQDGPEDTLFLSAPGVYQCTIFNTFGCEATSEPFVLCPQIELIYDADNQTLSVPEGFESYAWMYNGLPLPDGGNSIDASNLGNYSVTITTDYGCEVSSEVFSVTVGVEAIVDSAIQLWPNPARDYLSYTLPEGRWNLSIYTINGQLVQHQEGVLGGLVQRASVAHLQVGTYFIVIENQLERHQVRVMVLR